ncbi:MAG: FAD-binding oxidoreductase [Pseudomonadota bacterium]
MTIPRGPMADTLYNPCLPVGTWWAETLPPAPARLAAAGDIRGDVAVIGAGYAGLAAAMTLAEAGRRVIVLDAGRVGWGASGRNGGICGPGGDKLAPALMARRHGPGANSAWGETQAAAVAWVRAFHKAEGLDDHVQGDGEMVLAHGPASARALSKVAETDPQATPVAPSGKDDIARHGGVVWRPAMGINPLAYARALAAAAERAGAVICEDSPVTALSQGAARHRLMTPEATVTADTVLITTNGFTPLGLDRRLDGLAVPVISNIAVTRPLSAREQACHPWLGAQPAADTRHMLAYFRLLPDGRLLYGARGNLTGSARGMTPMRRQIEARIARDLPGFAGAEITHFWQGPIAATTRLTPTVAWLDREARIAVALGWHGSGIAMASLGGRLAGQLIASNGEGAIPAPMAGLPRRLPFPRLSPAYVGLAIAGLRAADWIIGRDWPWQRRH